MLLIRCDCVANLLRMCCECVANVLLLSCQCVANVLSMTDMFTAICDETAAEITTLVANGKTEGKCSDTGAAFSPPAKATTPVEAMPKPASARRWCSRHLSSRMPSWCKCKHRCKLSNSFYRNKMYHPGR